MPILKIASISELIDAIVVRTYNDGAYCIARGLISDLTFMNIGVKGIMTNGAKGVVYENYVQLVTKAHGNCQVSAVGYINNILYMLEGIDMPKELNKQAGKVVINKMLAFSNAKHANTVGNTLFSVDIFAELMPKLKEYFNVVVETPPYISTNGSTLQLAIIKI